MKKWVTIVSDSGYMASLKVERGVNGIELLGGQVSLAHKAFSEVELVPQGKDGFEKLISLGFEWPEILADLEEKLEAIENTETWP